jgi:hypothetical protein
VARDEAGHIARRTAAVRETGAHVLLTLSADVEPRGVVVRVVGEGGAPVQDAVVEVFGAVAGYDAIDWGGPPALTATSDLRGEVHFADAVFIGGIANARAPDGRVGTTKTWRRKDVEAAQRAGGILVTVRAASSLAGELRGLAPEELDRARVLAFEIDNTNPYYTTHGRALSTAVVAGRYRFDGLAAGKWTISIADPGGARLVLPPHGHAQTDPNSVEPLVVEVAAGSATTLDLAVVRGGSIEGTVRRADGSPVAGAQVLETFAPVTPNIPDGYLLHGVNVWRFDSGLEARSQHPETHRRARSDANGRYRLDGLHPGSHRIEIVAPGLSYDRRETVAVADAATITLDHVLEPAGAIRGVLPRSGYLGVMRAGESEPIMIAILPHDGSFAFGGLAAGRFTLAHFHSDVAIRPVELATVEVRAGMTTWIDLGTVAMPVRLSGRVLDSRGPVGGAIVFVHPERIVTDAEGQFEVRTTFPHSRMVSFGVERDAVVTRFEFPGMEHDAREWQGDLVLGEEELLVRTLDARGVASMARLEIAFDATSTREAGGIRAVSVHGEPIDDRGELRLRGLAAGSYGIFATFPDGSLAHASVDVPTTQIVELRAPPTGALAIELYDATGAPTSGLWVSVSVWADALDVDGDPPVKPIAWRRGAADVAGKITFAGVAAGEVLVRAFASHTALATGQDFGRGRLTLAAGETRAVSISIDRR